MKPAFALSVLLLLSTATYAKDKPIPLSPAVAAGLSGKTIVVTRHQTPSFVAMTAGKATFGLLGVGAMVGAGQKIVADNQIADPAEVVERELAPAIAKAYGLELKPATSRMISVTKPAQVAATQSDADLVLDIRTGGWMFSYYPGSWNTYWVMYSVQVQLVDAKSKALLSNMACNATTNKHPKSPTKDAMLADGARLLKDMTTGLAWNCVQLLAKGEFNLADGAVAATPTEYVDVLASYAQAHSAAATPAATAVAAAPTPNPTATDETVDKAATDAVAAPVPADSSVAPAAPTTDLAAPADAEIDAAADADTKTETETETETGSH